MGATRTARRLQLELAEAVVAVLGRVAPVMALCQIGPRAPPELGGNGQIIAPILAHDLLTPQS